MKFMKMIIPISAVAVIGMSSFVAPAFSSIEKTPEIQGSIFYSMENTPSGFNLVGGYNNSDLSEVTGKQNPNPVRNDAGTCTFSPTIAYLPSDSEGRGDSYLTRAYIYENAQISKHLPSVIKKKFISADNTNLEVLVSSYDVPASKDSGDDKNGYYRTVAVRAMDKIVSVPYATDTDTKGLPAVIMTYDCQTENDYRENDLSALLSSVNINTTDTVSNAPAPEKDTVKPTAEPTATSIDSPSAPETPADSPTDAATDGSTDSTNEAVGTEPSPVGSTEP